MPNTGLGDLHEIHLFNLYYDPNVIMYEEIESLMGLPKFKQLVNEEVAIELAKSGYRI